MLLHVIYKMKLKSTVTYQTDPPLQEILHRISATNIMHSYKPSLVLRARIISISMRELLNLIATHSSYSVLNWLAIVATLIIV